MATKKITPPTAGETTTAPATGSGMGYRMERVMFHGGGDGLVGNLFLPERPAPDGGYAAMVVAGPWTQVKEQTADTYGAKLAERGYAALSFDFRFWGESGGEPRYYESQGKAADLGEAVSFLAARPEINTRRIGLYGVCFGAGYVLSAASRDERVRAVVTTAAWLHDRPSLAKMFGEEEVERRLRVGAEARARWEADGILETVPAWEEGNTEAGMSFPGGYYSTPERGRHPRVAQQARRALLAGLGQPRRRRPGPRGPGPDPVHPLRRLGTAGQRPRRPRLSRRARAPVLDHGQPLRLLRPGTVGDPLYRRRRRLPPHRTLTEGSTAG